MSNGQDPSVRLRASWLPCPFDGRRHAVTRAAVAAGRRSGRFDSVCGQPVAPGSAAKPSDRRCERCARYLAALASLRDMPERLGLPRHRKSGWLRRLFGVPSTPVVPPPRPHSRVVSASLRGGRTLPRQARAVTPISLAPAGPIPQRRVTR